jgi:acyl dehydratase
MSLDLSAVGATTETFVMEYDWRTLVLYALGIGATPNELDYLYERRGPRIYPTFAVVPAYPVLDALLKRTGGAYEMVVHQGQTVTVHNQLPPGGKLETKGTLKGMYDLKRMALVVLESESRLDGTLMYSCEWQIIYRNEGGFGGDRRPKSDSLNVPKRTPDWTFDEVIPPQQALLYRLSGDTNPLHADPEMARSVGFEQGPILHGLATFGYVCRAVVQNQCAGDAGRLKSLTAQFKRPVWPGDTLRTEGFVDDRRILLQAFAKGPSDADFRSEAVLGSAAAELV